MPTYVYECADCGVRFERLQSYTDTSLRDCPECGGHVHRVIQPVGVIFKGSGFYVTDNKGKSSTGIPAPGAKKDETPAAPATEKKAESGSSDKASAASSTPASSSSTSKHDD